LVLVFGVSFVRGVRAFWGMVLYIWCC